MTTGEASKLWSTEIERLSSQQIRQLCEYGLIPFAEFGGKTKKRWDVPQMTSKPTFTCSKYYRLIKFIGSVRQGAYISFSSLGLTDEQVIKGYDYLSSCGFITKLQQEGSLMDKLNNVHATDLGNEFVIRYEESRMRRQKKTTKEVQVGMNAGVFQGKASLKTEK